MKKRLKKNNIREEFNSRVIKKTGINPMSFGNLFKESGRIDDVIEFYTKRETDATKRKKLKKMTRESDLAWLKAGKAEMKYLSNIEPEIREHVATGKEEKIDSEKVKEIEEEVSKAYEDTLKLMKDVRGFIKEKEEDD